MTRDQFERERDLFWNKVKIRISQNYNLNAEEMTIYDVFLTLTNLEKDFKDGH